MSNGISDCDTSRTARQIFRPPPGYCGAGSQSLSQRGLGRYSLARIGRLTNRVGHQGWTGGIESERRYWIGGGVSRALHGSGP